MRVFARSVVARAGVARGMSRWSARAPSTVAPGGTQARFLSSGDEVVSLAPAKAAVAEKWRTVTPWHARDLVPSKKTEDIDIAVIAGLSDMPEKIRQRKVRIFRVAKGVVSTGSWKTKSWRFDFEKQVRWNNELMGWTSGADPLAQLYQLRFESSEDAVRFLRKHGFSNYEISDFNEARDFHGKKHYSHNFLSEAVENKIKVSKPSQIMSQHFKWSKPFTSNWPNLERRDFGPDMYVPDQSAEAPGASNIKTSKKKKKSKKTK